MGFQTKKSLCSGPSQAESEATHSHCLLHFSGIQGSAHLSTVKAILLERCLITAEPHWVDAQRGI